MSADTARATFVGRRRTDAALAAGVLVALFAAMLPLLRVIDRGWWVPGALGLAAAILAAGFAARWLRLPGVAVALIEGVVWLVGLTAMFASGTAIAWIIPTPATFELVPAYVSAAVDEIMLSAAPLQAGPALTFVLVAAIGIVALAMDHVVLTARMPLLAGVGFLAVSLIPAIAVPGDLDLTAFVWLAVSILFLLRTDTRARQRQDAAVPATRRPTRSDDPMPAAGVAATAIGIGAVAVLVALVATPLLPAPAARAGSSGGLGTGTTIDPTLQLGDDLRQPREVEVLSMRSTAPSPPYLRAVTLSRFDGAVWQPDAGRTLPLTTGDDFPPLETDPEITVNEYRTTVEITDLNSPWLPVAFPATTVTGLEGDWGAVTQNRTVVTRTGSTRGQVYEVLSSQPRPTLEQIRARASGGDLRDEVYELPADLPPIIEQTARELTANAETDFDRLQTLQAWFRGPEFAYSLEAPVEDGFDGSGADAVAQFLEQREGYCVHFASAFALMARTLGMPARIVVGYLPGVNTSATTQGQTIYSVLSSQLHAWPEVHFPGIGWVAFEPTNSLGVPTSFASGVRPDIGTPADRAPQEAAQPDGEQSAAPTTGARSQDDILAGGATPGASGPGSAWPGIGIAALVLAVLAAPGLVREARRRQLLAAATGGDAASAWLSLQELAIDLRIPVPGAESPRAFAARLVAEHGAPRDAMDVLVSAIERASYAHDPRRAHHADFAHGDAFATALGEVAAGLRAASTVGRRILAVTVPRSLVVRPGSAYAGGLELATAR